MNTTQKPKYEVECQDAPKTGVRHEATFSHENEYGQKVYTVVCDCDESGTWYDERYTDEVVYEVGTVQYGNDPEDLDLTPASAVEESPEGLVTRWGQIELTDPAILVRREDLVEGDVVQSSGGYRLVVVSATVYGTSTVELRGTLHNEHGDLRVERNDVGSRIPVFIKNATYVDPYPGRKGDERVWFECGKCSGSGSVSWGVDANAAVLNADGTTRIVGKACFDCHGVGQISHLVSSARSTARRQVKATIAEEIRVRRFREQQEELEAAAAVELAAKVEAFNAEHADVVEALAAMTSDFGASLREQVRETGSLSENQRATVLRIAAEAASDPAPSPVPTGRIVITGKVAALKTVDGFRPGSSVEKVTVLDDRGFKVYGTLPSGLYRAERGDRVTLTATLEPSEKDETFGFFSRPTKADFLD